LDSTAIPSARINDEGDDDLALIDVVSYRRLLSRSGDGRLAVDGVGERQHGRGLPPCDRHYSTARSGPVRVARDVRERWWRLLLALALLVLILLVPFSRVYLGVHWPFDTIASLDLGAALLAIVITLFKYPPFEHLLPDLVAVAAGAIFATARIEPEARPQLPPMSASIGLDQLGRYPQALRQSSEDLIGGPMEPVSFLFVGDAQQLRSSFERAGWSLADTPSATGLTRELMAVIRDAPDPHGPATPAYFNAQPQDFTFELTCLRSVFGS
jgi:hypothetical protein